MSFYLKKISAPFILTVMNSSLLSYLVCPTCSSDLDLLDIKHNDNEIDAGLLVCRSDNGHIFPVVFGIPRMLPDAMDRHLKILYDCFPTKNEQANQLLTQLCSSKSAALTKDVAHVQKSFSSEWAFVNEQTRAWGRSVEDRKKILQECFDEPMSVFKDKDFFDAGCGHGEVLLALKDAGANICAMDLSFTVDELYQRIGKIPADQKTSTYHFVQGDVHHPPFRDGIFDFVHSAGVLHHTPDTFKGFQGISRKLKERGKCFVEVYSYDHMPLWQKGIRKVLQLSRIVTTRLPHPALHVLCYALAPFWWLLTRLLNLYHGKEVYKNRTLKELELSIFDDLSPRFQYHHSAKELGQWFHDLGFSEVKETIYNHAGIGLVGAKTNGSGRI